MHIICHTYYRELILQIPRRASDYKVASDKRLEFYRILLAAVTRSLSVDHHANINMQRDEIYVASSCHFELTTLLPVDDPFVQIMLFFNDYSLSII